MALDGGVCFCPTAVQDVVQPDEDSTTCFLHADEEHESVQGSMCDHPSRQPKHYRLGAKRRRKKGNKAKKKHKEQKDWDAMCGLADSDREETHDFITAQGLEAGLPVFHYLVLVRLAYIWATTNLQDPLQALEDIENWKVRGTRPHPAVLSFPPLLECHEHFEKCWQFLAPRIQQKECCSRSVAEDLAAETVADLICYMFGIWDERSMASTSTTKPAADLGELRETGVRGETIATQTEEHANEPGCNASFRSDPFDSEAWRCALQPTTRQRTGSAGVESTPSQVLDPPSLYFECAD